MHIKRFTQLFFFASFLERTPGSGQFFFRHKIRLFFGVKLPFFEHSLFESDHFGFLKFGILKFGELF